MFLLARLVSQITKTMTDLRTISKLNSVPDIDILIAGNSA